MQDTSAQRESLNGQRVLVTGAGGFIGSHLVQRLIREGAVVAALCRRRGRLDRIGRGDYSFLACDLTNLDQTRQAVASFAPSILFHFASEPDGPESFEHAKRTLEVNALGTLHVLEAFRQCGGRLFLFGDSCKVYGNGPVPYRESTPPAPNSSYALSKVAGWQLCQLYRQLHDVAVVSLRPTIIYGPHQSFNLITFVVKSALERATEIRLDGGDQTRDPLFIDDAIEAFIAAAQIGAPLDGRVINIGGGREISISALAKLIVELANAQIPVVCCPERSRPTEMWRSFCDNAEAAELLGWRCRVALEEGLQMTIDHLAGLHSKVIPTAS